MRRLEFVTNHADYNELVLGGDPAGQTDAVVNHLASTTDQWDVVDLRDLPESAGAQAIGSLLQRAGLRYCIVPEAEACPFLAIDGDSSELIKKLSGDSRRTLRQRMTRAAAEGLRVRIIEHPESEPDLLRKLIALDHQKHLQKHRPAFIGTYPEVFQSLFDRLGPRGCLYVALMESGSRPVAFQFGFRSSGRLWDYSKAYDRAFSRFAPGAVLLTALVDYGFTHGCHEYDFLRGEEPYKMVWSTGCHRRSRLLIWNRRLQSRFSKFVYHDLRLSLYRLSGKRI
jgi:CelD/BcsL family acetyltransferase involved in cellulose biosynthesis